MKWTGFEKWTTEEIINALPTFDAEWTAAANAELAKRN